MADPKEKIIKDLKWLIQNNQLDLSGLETSKIRRVLGGVLSTPGVEGIEGLEGLYGTELANAGANLESRILGGLRVLPGDNVHHIVPLGLLRDALQDHPISVQQDVLKRIQDEFGVSTGNSKRNLESILEFTHVFAGDKAAHPQGDTVQRYLRPVVLPPGASSKDIFDSIKGSLQTALNQYKNAVAPGTVEAARRKNLVDKFTDTFGVKVNPFELEADELKGISNALKISRAEASDLDTKNFGKFVQNEFLQKLADNPLGERFTEVAQDQYNRFNDFLARRAIQLETGFKRGFGDLQPDAPPFGARAESSGFKNKIKAWLTTNGLEQNRTNVSLARKALQSEFNANLLKKQNAGAISSDLLTAPADLMIKNKLGTAAGLMVDRDVGKLLGQGKVGKAAFKGSINAMLGASSQGLLKRGLSLAAKRIPGAATRIAAGTAASGPAMAIAGPMLTTLGAADIVDGFVEGLTGKPTIRHISDPINASIQQQTAQAQKRAASKQQLAASLGAMPTNKLIEVGDALSNVYPTVKPKQVIPKVITTKPKSKSLDLTNELEYFVLKPIGSAYNKIFGNRGV
jgi:hypothetical protein